MDHLIDPAHVRAGDGPELVAVKLSTRWPRVTQVHCHARGQLFGSLRGLLTVTSEANCWIVPSVHAVWIPPHTAHALRSHGPFNGWSVYVTEASSAGLPVEPCTMRTSALLLEAVARASTWPRELPLDAAQSHVAAVILDEIRSLPREQFGLPVPRDRRLLRITSALATDLSDTRRLEEWAKWAGLSPRTLSRRFLAETGFTFSGWRQRARLMKAVDLIAAGASVTAIAMDLGYGNVSAFIAMFKREFATTPSAFAEDVVRRHAT